MITFDESPPGNDWRKLNEEAGLLADDDCRRCSGMGRVPFAVETGASGIPMARYRNCPDCGGKGKKAVKRPTEDKMMRPDEDK